MSTPCAERSPHGCFIQLIPQYFKVAGDTGRLSFTERGLFYYGHWYSRYGLPFLPGSATLSSLKSDLLRMVASELNDEATKIQQDLEAGRVSGLGERVARAVLGVKFHEAATYANLARMARSGVVVALPQPPCRETDDRL